MLLTPGESGDEGRRIEALQRNQAFLTDYATALRWVTVAMAPKE